MNKNLQMSKIKIPPKDIDGLRQFYLMKCFMQKYDASADGYDIPQQAITFKFNQQNTHNLAKQLFLTDKEIPKSTLTKNPIDERTPGADNTNNDNNYATYINGNFQKRALNNDVINNYADLENQYC